MADEVRLCYRVCYADTDQMGVVYYANYLVLFERARGELMRSWGAAYGALEESGTMLPVVEAHIDYRVPALYDDELEIAAWVGWARGVRLRMNCRVERNGEVLATGYTTHACVDSKRLRPKRIPDVLLDMIGEEEKAGRATNEHVFGA